MKRRKFLQKSMGAAAILGVPSCLQAKSSIVEKAQISGKKVIFIRMQGANDFLNTLIPFADTQYKKIRPKLHIKNDKVLKINEKLGFHPSLKNIYSLFKEKKVGLIQGIAMSGKPVLSHFKAMDIVESLNRDLDTTADGWLAKVYALNNKNKEKNIKAIMQGFQDLGPFEGNSHGVMLAGNHFTSLNVNNKKMQMMTNNHENNNEALNHILSVQETINEGKKKLMGIKVDMNLSDKSLKWFEKRIIRQSKFTVEFLAKNKQVPWAFISMNGFDTHKNQLATHQKLLHQFDLLVFNLLKSLRQKKLSQDTIIVTYSEFGRRAAENASLGTDHGTAGLSFVVGDKVKGGLFGKYPSLTDLAGQNLKSHIYFEDMYKTLTLDWMGFKKFPFKGSNIPFI